MEYILGILFIVLVIFVLVLLKTKRSNGNKVTVNKYKYKQKSLMTENEFEFFNRLIQAFPNYYILPQVSMGAVLDVIKEENKSIQAGRNTFNKKIIDYLIYSKDKKTVAIIELDDKTHNKEKDEKRDEMLLQAGYQIYRFDSRKKPTIEQLKEIIILE